MLILGIPKNPDMYLAINAHHATKLHKMGFPPKYRNGNTLYFKKTLELEKAIRNIERR